MGKSEGEELAGAEKPRAADADTASGPSMEVLLGIDNGADVLSMERLSIDSCLFDLLEVEL